jgi:hypothetical protein
VRQTQPPHSEVFAYALAHRLSLPEAKRRLTEERRRTASTAIDVTREKSREAPRSGCPAIFSDFDAHWMQRN